MNANFYSNSLVGARRLLGIVLILVPLLPLTFIRSEVRGLAGLMTGEIWLLSIFILLTLSWLLALLLSTRLEHWFSKTTRWVLAHQRICLAVFIVAIAILIYLISAYAFNHRPHLIDTINQIFHAKILASGELFSSAPFDYSFFMTQHMVVDDGRFYSQYPPGHLIILAIGELLNRPWIVCIVLAVSSLPLLYLFVRDAYNREVAVLATVMMGLSPFYLFMSSNYMNHISELFFVLLALRSFQCWENRKRPVLAMVTLGISGGMLFLVRPFTAIIVGVIFLVLIVPYLFSSKRNFFESLIAPLAALPFGLFLLYFQFRTTGDPLLPGYNKLWGAGHGLGFHVDPWGDLHTPLRGLLRQTAQILELNEFLFEFPFPALIPLGLLLLLSRRLAKWDSRLLFCFLIFPVAYLFYWHRDSFLGPRFLYVTIAFLVPLTAHALVVAYRWSGDKTFGLRGIIKPVPLRALLLSTFALSYLYLASVSAPHRYIQYAYTLPSFKLDLEEKLKEAGVNQGVVFVAVSWGHRIISQLRGAGVPANVVQAAYRKVDSCDLYHLLLDYQSGSISSKHFGEKIEELMTVARPVEFIAGVGRDETLRFWRGRGVEGLSAECLDELEYDREGFTNYAPFFADNNPTLSAPLIFATDLRLRNAELLSHYPELSGYLYRGEQIERLGLAK